MKKTIISMPVANEENTIEGLIHEIMALPYDNLFLYLIIDNFSKDNTENVIRNMEKKYNRVKLYFYEKSTGAVSCYLYGFQKAITNGAEWIIEMDGGRSHLPSELPKFINQLEAGFDCVWGSRFIRDGGISNHPLYRRVLSSGGTILANIVLGTKLKDMTSGYEAFNKEVIENFKFEKFLSKGHMYQTEMRYYCRKYKAIEVPIHYVGSQSGIRFNSVKEALLLLLFRLKKNENLVFKK